MPTIDRRTLLVAGASSAAVAISGLALITDKAQSAPMTLGPVPAAGTEDRIEKAVVVVGPRRRRVCRWRRGVRVCTWV
jgi:hypothetical protein